MVLPRDCILQNNGVGYWKLVLPSSMVSSPSYLIRRRALLVNTPRLLPGIAGDIGVIPWRPLPFRRPPGCSILTAPSEWVGLVRRVVAWAGTVWHAQHHLAGRREPPTSQPINQFSFSFSQSFASLGWPLFQYDSFHPSCISTKASASKTFLTGWYTPPGTTIVSEAAASTVTRHNALPWLAGNGEIVSDESATGSSVDEMILQERKIPTPNRLFNLQSRTQLQLLHQRARTLP